MIKSKVAVVTTGFLGLLSTNASATQSDFVTNGKVTKFNRKALYFNVEMNWV